MLFRAFLALVSLYVLAATAWILDAGRVRKTNGTELLNVSYDPTRELWRDLNVKFIAHYQQERGEPLTIRQSHGGSSSQARAVIDGLDADVVTLALWSDVDAIRRKGLLADNWETRLPGRSPALFLHGGFRRPQRQSARHPRLAGSAAARRADHHAQSQDLRQRQAQFHGGVGSGAGARRFRCRRPCLRDPDVPPGAGARFRGRGATTTFAQKKIGDVHLTWENEVHLEVTEAHGELELIYPPLSIRAEPPVAWVDANVRRKGTQAAAEAYLRYLYTDEAQEIIAAHYYRPSNEAILDRHRDILPDITLFPVTNVALSWDDAQERFFAEGAVFDRIFTPQGH